MNTEIAEVFPVLERGVQAALETYSNIHRGSGHFSIVSTLLFEQARDITLEYLGLDKDKYVVIFCTPRGAEMLKAQLKPGIYQCISSRDIGLSLGVRALAVKCKALPRGTPFQTGGGTARLVSRGWVIWAKSPQKFEAGTPAIINVIAFAIALQLVRHFGIDAFRDSSSKKMSAPDILYSDELKRFSGQDLLNKLRETLIGGNILVPTLEGDKPFINLDNGASTPTFMPIWDAVCLTWRQSEKIHQDIAQEVKSICAEVLDAPLASYEVIFTSNTTEAINLVNESMRNDLGHDTEPVVLNTLLEHNSNDLPWRSMKDYSLIRLSVDKEGFVDLHELDNLLRTYNQEHLFGKKRIKLVAVSGASNVLGVFNNLTEISGIVHMYGAQLLVDAAQLVAHRKVEIEGFGIDYLAFSAHKVYAPFGCGVLVVKKGLLNFSSEKLESIKSSGEENAVGIAALGKALLLLQRIGMDIIQEEEQKLTGQVLKGIAKIPGLRVHGINDPESPRFSLKGGVIAFDLTKMMSDKLAKELAELGGIGVRFGCHCAHILVKHLVGISPVLEQLQRLILTLFPKVSLPGITRVSLGIENSEKDVDALIQVMEQIARKSGSLASSRSASAQKDIPIHHRVDIEQQIKEFTSTSAMRVYSQISL